MGQLQGEATKGKYILSFLRVFPLAIDSLIVDSELFKKRELFNKTVDETDLIRQSFTQKTFWANCDILVRSSFRLCTLNVNQRAFHRVLLLIVSGHLLLRVGTVPARVNCIVSVCTEIIQVVSTESAYLLYDCTRIDERGKSEKPTVSI